jgi:hypothetical protein
MLLRPLLAVLLASYAAAQSPNWYLRPAATVPVSGPYLLEYDALAHRCLLFARESGGQTWSWDGRAWSLLSGSAPISDAAQMVWDSARQRMLIVTSGTSSGRTRVWVWSGSAWTLVLDANPFVGRENFAAAFDETRGRLVFHGGIQSGSTNFHDTWEFDGSTWTQRSSGGPSPRDSHTLTYDRTRGVCVLFGGRNDDHSPFALGDVWEWDGQQWREFFGQTGPAARLQARATYDPVHRRVLVYGGTDMRGNDFRDLWAWDGSSWQQIVTPARPSGRSGALAFDPQRGVAVLLTQQPVETWEFYDDQPSPGLFTVFGSGCAGSLGEPRLTAAGGPPRIGEDFVLGASPVSVHLLSRAFGILGTSTTSWNGFPLPLALAPFGAPGCALLVGIDDVVPLTRNGLTAAWTLPIPFDRRLVGRELDVQVLVLDPGVNPAGMVLSDGGRILIGN